MLNQLGFNKKGNNFYLETGKDYGVVNFQKSRESTKDVVKFTINFGVYSDVLGKYEFDYNNSVKPEVEKCHWRARVGAFMPGSPDYWWKVNMSDNLSGIASNVMVAVQSIIVPEINKRLTDEGLINCWMNENYAGTTEIGRFKYLTILLKNKGDFNTLNQVVESFMQQSKGKPNASRAIEHLKEIEYCKRHQSSGNLTSNPLSVKTPQPTLPGHSVLPMQQGPGMAGTACFLERCTVLSPGHSFAIERSTALSPGHSFALEQRTALSPGRSFALERSTAQSPGHSFALERSTALSPGHSSAPKKLILLNNA